MPERSGLRNVLVALLWGKRQKRILDCQGAMGTIG
jgi:hypothetical protein